MICSSVKRNPFISASCPGGLYSKSEEFQGLRSVATLVDSLAKDDAAEARELVRSLIEHITLHPDGDGQRVEVRGELAAILALSAGAKGGATADAAGLALQVKMVAGAGFEPAAFRL
jgi:site-specific DNA recombinase